MLPPEILRIVLLIGLAATGYMMILAWSDDRQANSEPVTYDQGPVLDASPSDLPDAAVTVDAPTVTDSDVPDASLIADSEGVTEPVSNVAQTVQSNDRLIKVTTPSHWVWIDLQGGDVVRVQLPKFPISLDRPDLPYKIMDQAVARLYVAQSGLVGTNGTDSNGRARYYADVDSLEVVEGSDSLVLKLDRPEGQVRKIFTFHAHDYLIDVRYEMDNVTAEPLKAALFAQIKRDARPPETEESFALAPQPYLGAAFTTPEENYLKLDFEDVDEQRFDTTVMGGWVAFLQHYFLSAWVAPQEENNRFFARPSADGRYLFGFTGGLKTVAPGSQGEWQTSLYVGPKDQKRLEEIAPNLNLTIDYGFLWWLAMPLFLLLDFLYSLVGNWGLAIILLTFVVKAVLYPLSAAGYKSMANMRRVAPAMKKLQERYANDREKLSREMMALYKKEGANPLGGCLPMLLPMPIFIALYWVLFESVELRQAPFFLWIEDLSQMDPLFILPLLMGASTYWMQSLSPQVGDPMQQRMMKMMPIMFTVLFLFFPAGLVLYWLVNNLLSIAQQQYVYRKADQAQAQA